MDVIYRDVVEDDDDDNDGIPDVDDLDDDNDGIPDDGNFQILVSFENLCNRQFLPPFLYS